MTDSNRETCLSVCSAPNPRRALERTGVLHPQIRAPKLTDVEQPRADPLLKTVDQLVEFSAKRREVVRLAPLADEHSRRILADLDYGPAEIDALIEKGAVSECARWANAVNP
jgi:crotonobetainyl-CoA:carnitine CoA-transferase CaiB-like acyl-CoA transferase